MKKISDLILYKFPFFQIFKKIGIFDENFKELKTVALTDATMEKGYAGNRPGLLKVGNKLFITYDRNRKSYVQELTIKT